MAFENIGLTVILNFDGNRFSQGIKKPRDELGRFIKKGNETVGVLGRIKVVGVGAFRALQRSMGRMSAGFGKIKAGMTQAAFAFTPLTIGVGAGIKTFADFQQQMQNVKSVSSFTTEQFEAMRQKSKQLGATTQFTATQAGEGFEALSRAGFDFEDQMSAIEGTLALAAADSIDLGTATEITANVLRAMGEEAGRASDVADILAATSANANTNVTALGESFKFAAPVARQMGIDTESTAVALGLISNAGLKGTLAGNAFKNMLLKLAKPTSKGKELMKDLKIQVFETADGNLDLKRTMESVIEGTKDMTSKTKRAAAIMEILGLRGQGAQAALEQAIQTGQFDKLTEAINNSAGAAKRMAETRLDSFMGQITLLKSAAEGFAIEVFEPFATMGQSILKDEVIPFIQDLVAAIQFLKNPTAEGADQFLKMNETVKLIALGIMDAIDAIKSAFEFLREQAKKFGDFINEKLGEGATRKIAKWVTIFIAIAAAIAPVIIAIVAIGFAISAISTVVSGVASLISGAFLPVLLIGGAIFLILAAMKRENESFGQTAVRVWGNIKAWALDVWENVLKPIWAGIQEAATIVIPELQRVWSESIGIIKEALIDLFNVLGFNLDKGATDWKEVGKIMVFVIASVIEAVIKLATFVVVMVVTAVKLFKAYAMAVADFLIFPFLKVWNLVSDLFLAFKMVFQGDIVGGLKQFGKALLNFILAPLRLIIRNIVRLADAIPGLGDTIPQGLRDFANEGSVKLLKVGDVPAQGSGTRGVPPFLKKRDEDLGAKVAEKSAEAEADSSLASIEAMAQGLKDAAAEANKPVTDKLDEVAKAAGKSPCIDNNVSVAIDNETVARGQARHNAELKERAGFNTTPWQRRTALEFGAAPVRGGGGA